MAGNEGALGLLAGSGEVPRRLIRACQEQGRPVFVIAFHGQTDPQTAELADHIWTRLAAAGEILDAFRANNVTEIVFAGPIKRPSFSTLRPDWRAARFFAKIGKKALSDDGLLGSVVRALEEEEGFKVVGIDDVLGGVLASSGPLGRHRPDTIAQADIARGLEVARTLGEIDVGQSVVVQEGVVLGVEAVEGTDALLRRAAELRREGPGGVLVKIKKPQQERRVDLPTIGPKTVSAAAAAGLRGVAVQARATLVMERKATIETADGAGLFVVGLDLET